MNAITNMKLNKNGTYVEDKGIDFSEITNAVTNCLAEAKGVLSNGVKWIYNHATGVVKICYRFCSEKLNTIIDGVRKGCTYLLSLLTNMFSKEK